MMIRRRHPFTGVENSMDIDVTEAQMHRWSSGELIQNVMPHLTADEREFIKTGITNWDDIFGGEE